MPVVSCQGRNKGVAASVKETYGLAILVFIHCATLACTINRDLDQRWFSTFHAYARAHRHLIHEGSGKEDILIVEPWTGAGWGNRIPSLITATAIAILTERLLLVDFPHLDMYLNSSLDWSFHKHKAKFNADLSPGRRITGRDVDVLLREDLRRDPHRILHFFDDDYSMFLLQMNPHYDSFFSHFLDGVIFRRIARAVFRPSVAIRREIEKFMAAKFGPHGVIGLQMRSLKVQLDPSNFYDVARILSRKEQTVFLASDAAYLYNHTRTALLDRSVVWTENGVGCNTTASVIRNPGTELSGLVDLFLLSKCSDLIITYSSSFGYVAAALAGIKPVYVLPRKDNEHGHYFFRAISSEPCFFRMRSLSAMRTLQMHPLWIQHVQCHF